MKWIFTVREYSHAEVKLKSTFNAAERPLQSQTRARETNMLEKFWNTQAALGGMYDRHNSAVSTFTIIEFIDDEVQEI